MLHNFIRDEQQTDQLIEVQDLKFLSVVDEELVHQSREGVQNNVNYSSYWGGWIFELQWGPLMVIFHNGDAAEDKAEEVRGGAIH